jgi:hypothetical protein
MEKVRKMITIWSQFACCVFDRYITTCLRVFDPSHFDRLFSCWYNCSSAERAWLPQSAACRIRAFFLKGSVWPMMSCPFFQTATQPTLCCCTTLPAGVGWRSVARPEFLSMIFGTRSAHSVGCATPTSCSKYTSLQPLRFAPQWWPGMIAIPLVAALTVINGSIATKELLIVLNSCGEFPMVHTLATVLVTNLTYFGSTLA